jgi:hypothetical protein
MIGGQEGRANEMNTWVPMWWPCGPLEIERGRRRGKLTADERECLEHWGRPEALGLLDGTPVNTLVVPWADGSPGDDAHHRALGALVTAARERGLVVIGELGGEVDLGGTAAAARAAGLDAVATASTDTVTTFRSCALVSGASPGSPRETSWASPTTPGPA